MDLNVELQRKQAAHVTALTIIGKRFGKYLDIKSVNRVFMALISLWIVSPSSFFDFYESFSTFSGQIDDYLGYMLDYGAEFSWVCISDYCPVG